jgi:hypothetical protein
MAKQKEKIKKGIPGAVFVADLEKESREKPSASRASNSSRSNELSKLTKMMSDIKVSNKITGEQFEADLKQKQIRKLKKQLREIESIEEKVKANQTVEKEQLEKLKKKDTLIEELSDLGETVD